VEDQDHQAGRHTGASGCETEEISSEVNVSIPGNGALRWNSKLEREVLFKSGSRVKYGKPGSIRVDLIEKNSDVTWTVWDLKTGNAILDFKRIQQIKNAISPDDISLVTYSGKIKG
jgi:hypothetical protein